MNLVKHLEGHLGIINEGFKLTDREHHLSASEFLNQPIDEVKTICTLGLSNSLIGEYYMELIISVCNKYDSGKTASFLLSLSETLIKRNISIKKGFILGPEAPITDETRMNCIYFASPVFFEDDFEILKLENKTIIFPYLIPLYSEEAEIVKKIGSDKFEDFLEDTEVDNLWDLNRKSFINELLCIS